MQTIKTKNYGELTFVKTWADGGLHIGKLADGSYAHIGGPPVKLQRELTQAMPSGKDLDEALEWWDNKDKKPEPKKFEKRVAIQEDGSYAFEDGSPIETVSDLTNSIPPGSALNAAVAWFTGTVAKEKDTAEEIADKVEANTSALEDKKEEDKLKEPGRRCKYIMANGKQCGRWALPGSDYCALRQHK